MSKYETVHLASESHNMTFQAGSSLASTLYETPPTLWLSGDLGAGKTTFVQGLGKALGIDSIQSPTYALENRYGETLLHMDLYRLDQAEAEKMIGASDDFSGIRVVEWSERIISGNVGAQHAAPSQSQNIFINLIESSPNARQLEITFADIDWPDHTQIEKWREEMKLPEHIQRHCDVVGDFAETCAVKLLERGIIVRPKAARMAGQLHDLMRFVDFHPHGDIGSDGRNPKRDEKLRPFWKGLGNKYPGRHEEACAAFLEEKGYPELATIIRPHGLRNIDEPETLWTIEQKILYYADKRVKFDTIVTLDERFDDFVLRYGNGEESEDAKRWRVKTKELERNLFGKDIPW